MSARSIYTASKTRHAHLWQSLKEAGYPIISTWIYEAGEGETNCFSDLWTRCVSEASQADVLIAYREEDDGPWKGAFIEIGAALASGKPVFLVGDAPGFTFAHHPLVKRFPNIGDAFETAMGRPQSDVTLGGKAE